MTGGGQDEMLAGIMSQLASVTKRVVDERVAAIDVTKTSIIVRPNNEESAGVGVFVTPDRVDMCFGSVAVETPSTDELDLADYERLLRATVSGRIKERFRYFLGFGIGSEAIIELEGSERHYTTGMRPTRSVWQQKMPYQ